MNEEKLKEIYTAITKSWEIIKKYKEIKNEEPFWNACIKECSEAFPDGVAGDEFRKATLNVLEDAYRKKWHGDKDG